MRLVQIPVATFIALAFFAGTAQAQIASYCLRPLGIPDKWIENQTAPWDSTDTFDPTGPNPDVYLGGFDPLTDQGLPLTLVLYNRIDPPRAGSAWPLVVSEPGGGAFYDAIVNCSGYPHAMGESFPSMTGNPSGPFASAISELIALDPDATWDATANGGRGGVVNSAFAQSPRIIAMPVFAPDAYRQSTAVSPEMVKIVGFFVSERTSSSVRGYLTGWSQLTMEPATVRLGDAAQLSATLTGPGSPVAGLTLDFFFNDQLVGSAETDGTGTARPATASFYIHEPPGEYAGALRVRLRESGFFVADDGQADLTVLRKLPLVTWPQPADITYGTPLGPQHLNAVADVAGVFTYLPAAGTVLQADDYNPATLTATFVPDDIDLYDETTAATFILVRPAPLTVRIANAQKLYLDPLPELTFTATGLVNGDTAADIFGAATLQTTATASSPVGTYPITMGGLLASANYNYTIYDATLTIAPRPTTTVLTSAVPVQATYGQPVVFTIQVSSSVGAPSGTVTLVRGDVPLASATLVNGQASISLSTLAAGPHPLSAQYSGSGGFAASSSAFISYVVDPASTRTQLTSSVNPSRSGQAVTFTATVTPVAPGAGEPAGSVEFLRGGVLLEARPVVNGTAQLTIATLPVGKHAIQARYVGTNNFQTSLSLVVQQTVKGGGK